MSEAEGERARGAGLRRCVLGRTERGRGSGPVREGKAAGRAAGPRGVRRSRWAALDQFGLMGLGWWASGMGFGLGLAFPFLFYF